MVHIGPRPFLIGTNKEPLLTARQWFVRTIPIGAPWRLKYVLIDYPVIVAGLIQTSANLAIQFFDADGRAFNVAPVALAQVTSPSGTKGLSGTNPLNIDYPGGTNVKAEISVIGAGTLPSSFSLTMFGIRGWEGFGK